MKETEQRPDRREYTFMIVPHDGQAVRRIRIPIKAVKYTAAFICVIVTVLAGMWINYSVTVARAQAEKSELETLRQTNGDQSQKIEQISKATAALQQDLDRLNVLDAEIRRIANVGEQTATSRAGIARPTAAKASQGGPVVQPSINELADLLQEMKQEVTMREQSLADLKEALEQRNAVLNATPSIWPTNGDVTSRFGWRSSPWGGRSSDWHPGIDIANSTGTEIMATADGEVTHSGWFSGYGKMIEIDHGNGIVTIYGHNSQNVVSSGQHVKKGQVIAYMGSTGYSTGPHLHYEVRVNGTVVNPASFLH